MMQRLVVAGLLLAVMASGVAAQDCNTITAGYEWETRVFQPEGNNQDLCWFVYPLSGSAVRVSFTEMDTESVDYVYVGAGSVTATSSFSGTNRPPVTVATDFIYIRFLSDGSVLSNGFTYTYKSVDYETYTGVCGNGFLEELETCDDGGAGGCPANCGLSDGTCTSGEQAGTNFCTAQIAECNTFTAVTVPGYLRYNYGHNERICWTFVADGGGLADSDRLRFRFDYVDTEGCCDAVIVFQNGSPWRPFSGEVDFLPDYTTTSSDVALMMYSDGSVDGSGFGVFIDLCNLEGDCQEGSRSFNKALTYFIVIPFVFCAACLCLALVVKGTAKSIDARNREAAAAAQPAATTAAAVAAVDVEAAEEEDTDSDTGTDTGETGSGSGESSYGLPNYEEAQTMARHPKVGTSDGPIRL